MKYVRFAVLFLVGLLLIFPSGARAQEKKVYTLAVVPQMRPSEVFSKWVPFLRKLSQEAGVTIELKPYNTIQQFETDVLNGVPDFVYLNPYQAVSAKDAQGYVPFIKDATQLVGILVARKGGSIHSIQDLNDKELVFPTPQAFAASLYMRALLTQKEKIHFKERYVKTHDNVYIMVATDPTAAAGGGIGATLAKASNEIRNELTVIYQTPSIASHPLSAHPRVPEAVRKKLAKAILDLANDKANTKLFNDILMPEPVQADYQKDYLPLKKLGLKLEK